ncbi:thiamine pyrophosphate-binding protein [Fodinicola acaciae]|uniref:thiamine pyrophosphate-binding protein n=1 Tax=Fodinicola acaciae TaxID=2681555 RepID=UPI0013D5F6A0|nr:thiamine pyrophosphate-binding protein [Fodinicola acaciae]
MFSGRGADLLVECLVRAGVRHLFGVPGDTGVVFYDALYERTKDIRHVLARDERHAAAMADGYARVTNTVGVVEVSSGGGTTYVVGGLGEAYASGVPVLLITSDIHTRSRDTGALTEIDQEALFSAVTKWRTRVTAAEDIPNAVREALRQITSGRPAPAAVILPEDVLDQRVIVDESTLDGLATDVPYDRPVPENVELAAEMLSGAERPAILAGGGVHTSGAYDSLRRLAEKTQALVATTIHGRGVIADDHPLSIGVAGNNGGDEAVNDHLAKADVVLLVGTRANATDTDGFTAPQRTAKIIAIDIDPARAGRNYPDAVRLVGDADTTLTSLANAIRQPAATPRYCPPVPVTRRCGKNDGVLLPEEVIEAAQEVLGQVPVVADPGTPTPNVATYWKVKAPGRSVIVPRGHGPMGYAIPAAIGVAIARPGEPVLALTADGSFAMACGELETAARLDLPIVFIQFTNHSMGWIKMLQHLYTGQRYFSVDPGTIDAAKVAEASGIRGVRATDLDDVRKAVSEAVRDRMPVYVDVEVPHLIDHLPPVPAWSRALAGDRERPVY